MPTLLDLMRRLLPVGSNAPPLSGDEADLESPWALPPLWPPDAFAVAAHLVNRAGCYAHPRYVGPAGVTFFRPETIAELERVGREWARGPAAPSAEAVDAWLEQLLFHTNLPKWWNALLRHGHVEVVHRGPGETVPGWWDAALCLLVAADEAATGFGFVSSNTRKLFGPNLVFDEYVRYTRRQPRSDLRYLPMSLGRMVPAAEVCVQPKSVTAQVGCTLNNYTHNLSFLPSFREVRTYWRFAFEADEVVATPPHPMALNVLVVPFPYAIPPSAFQGGAGFAQSPGTAGRNPAHELRMDQTWLRHGGQPVGVDQFFDELLAPLLKEARDATGGPVHAVVLPEIALDKPLARGLAKKLAAEPGLEWFVAGAVFEKAGAVRNVAYASLFHNGEVFEEWWQPKHHRWKVDRSQIEGYGLATPHGPLDPANDYWEGINVEGRTCVTWAFRPGTTMSILVCEDLARREPVQDVIRAIGPNLVVALLMDGAQLPARWPGQYATVLADDPGSSVLTVTSLGLIERSNQVRQAAGRTTSRAIALWKEPAELACHGTPRPDGCTAQPGEAKPINLDPGHHATLLRLTSRQVGTFSLDGRHDGGATVRIHLKDCDQIRLPNPPAWIGPT